MQYLSIIVFFFGAIIGSFLNVVILRFRSGKTLKGRSKCFSCSRELSWTELVPIASFMTQKGKCTTCKTRISIQYPLVEIITGLLFVFLYWRIGGLLFFDPLWFGIVFAYYAIIISLLIILAVYDIRHTILPNPWTLLFGLFAFGGLFFLSGSFTWPDLNHLVAGLLLPIPFALLWLISRGRWMGFGDAKLAVGIGFLLGLQGGFAALLLAFWTGALYSILLVISSYIYGKKRVSLKTAVPFGPFLVLGTLLVFFGVSLDMILRFFG